MVQGSLAPLGIFRGYAYPRFRPSGGGIGGILELFSSTAFKWLVTRESCRVIEEVGTPSQCEDRWAGFGATARSRNWVNLARAGTRIRRAIRIGGRSDS